MPLVENFYPFFHAVQAGEGAEEPLGMCPQPNLFVRGEVQPALKVLMQVLLLSRIYSPVSTATAEDRCRTTVAAAYSVKGLTDPLMANSIRSKLFPFQHLS